MPVVCEFFLFFEEEPALCRHSFHGIIGILVSLFPNEQVLVTSTAQKCELNTGVSPPVKAPVPPWHQRTSPTSSSSTSPPHLASALGPHHPLYCCLLILSPNPCQAASSLATAWTKVYTTGPSRNIMLPSAPSTRSAGRRTPQPPAP
ncbi:hypothetical protein CFD26_100423 [Aspergillus turcosus]|uniref:Uncharacterized protein n=1 Tax=Aspergillus turcosus TaxID=1245748 RepID=A0A3R7F8E1_9EURO|nr:hypothetical protein CFD26_100423 [Aspergillus turcosus]